MDTTRFVQKIVNAYNQHRVEDLDELLTDDCVLVRNGVEAHGKDAVKEIIGRLFATVPDIEYEIDEIVASGDRLAVRWHGHGTAPGDYFGEPTSRGELRTEGITLYQLRDDRIAKLWISVNVVGKARGVTTQPEAHA